MMRWLQIVYRGKRNQNRAHHLRQKSRYLRAAAIFFLLAAKHKSTLHEQVNTQSVWKSKDVEDVEKKRLEVAARTNRHTISFWLSFFFFFFFFSHPDRRIHTAEKCYTSCMGLPHLKICNGFVCSRALAPFHLIHK